MFVYSFKASKRQIISMILCAIMLIAVLIVAIIWPLGKTSAETYKPVQGSSNDERVAFLKALGYEIDTQNPVVKEVLIPDEFDEVFERYNNIQKEAGMDLSVYHGKRLKNWTYRVLNIPDQGEVLANLYIYKNKIVGGDIHSTALDGFMHGLIQHKTGQKSNTKANPKS
ncbi:MAG: DUF4830 domain-containing protein [Oscillospiraceae bacterium]|nr:DUF4830 domain-containing protein [Oscillospiraceae bacterium]MDD4413721.1 DUF4830 domain-containing protein [Oscillospiraceae bacterium]